MGRRKKNPLTAIPSNKTELFNVGNTLMRMAIAARNAEHIKESTIQAAGLRERISPLKEVDYEE